MLKKIIALSVLTLLLVVFWAAMDTGARPAKVLRVRDGSVITFEQMMDDLKKVSVVFVGEHHDSLPHHQAQLNIIRELDKTGRPVSVGLEMFRSDSQHALDSWVSGTLPLDSFLVSYYDNWTMPWPLYSDIFDYARDNRVPLRGLNIPEGIAKKVAREGFASLTPEEKKHLPGGISCNVDPAYMEFIRRAYRGHSGHNDRAFVNFCEAQMVWDKSMAWNVARYLKDNPDRSMVVLAGVGHAWKRGISEQLETYDGTLKYRVVLPAVPNETDREDVTTADADYILLG